MHSHWPSTFTLSLMIVISLVCTLRSESWLWAVMGIRLLLLLHLWKCVIVPVVHKYDLRADWEPEWCCHPLLSRSLKEGVNLRTTNRGGHTHANPCTLCYAEAHTSVKNKTIYIMVAYSVIQKSRHFCGCGCCSHCPKLLPPYQFLHRL